MGEDDDPVVSEIPVFFVQPPNKQQIHLYEYPLRPKFKSFEAPSTVVYYPQSNQLQHNQALELDQKLLIDDPNSFSSIIMEGNSLVNFQENANYAIGFFEGDKLVLQPITEIYQMRPDFSYLNEEYEKDIKPLELDENQEIQTIENAQGSSYCYRYVTVKPMHHLQFSEQSSENLFNIPAIHYKNLFISEQNVMTKLYKQLEQVKDIRRKCEIITTKLQVYEMEQVRRLLKGVSDAEILLGSEAYNHCILGVFAVCSKFCIEKRMQLGRDILLLTIALGGEGVISKFGELMTVDIRECIENVVSERQTIYIERVPLMKMSGLECQEVSYIFELRNLVVFRDERWVFGYSPDYQYSIENQEQLVHEAQRLRSEIEDELEQQPEQQNRQRKALQVIREE